MWRCFIEPRTRKYVKGYGVLSFARKYKKQLLNTGLNPVKNASKKVVHKASEFMGHNIANNDKIVKHDENLRNVEEITTPLEKTEEILNELRQVLL